MRTLLMPSRAVHLRSASSSFAHTVSSPVSLLSRLRAYLELTRPANLVTAAADVLAGFALAGLSHGRSLLPLLIAGVLLYAGGVVFNDVFDRELDAVERPERPIPSGRASVRGAALLGTALLVAGVASALAASTWSAVIAAAIALLAVIYDRWGKRYAAVAPITMGACRGLNLLLGASALPAAVAESWFVGLIPLAYVGGITALSRGEVRGGQIVTARIATALVVAAMVGVAILATLEFRISWGAIPLLGLLAWRVLPPFARANLCPADASRIRSAVTAGGLSLIVLDAAIAAVYAGPLYGLMVLSLWVVAAGAARLFAVT